MRPLVIAALSLGMAACAMPSPRGTGDLGLVVERASGSTRSSAFSRDARSAEATMLTALTLLTLRAGALI